MHNVEQHMANAGAHVIWASQNARHLVEVITHYIVKMMRTTIFTISGVTCKNSRKTITNIQWL